MKFLKVKQVHKLAKQAVKNRINGIAHKSINRVKNP